jgi:acyl-coenzyme A synthetase/AMP-(fatty) acid ligase
MSTLEYPDVPLHALMQLTTQRRPNHIAIRHRGRVISFEAFDRESNRLAHGFISASVGNGDRVDPRRRMIKYKSFSIAPAELEAALLEHPDVADCAVTGVADREAGEIPKAFIVCRPGTTVDPDALSRFMSDRVAGYKQIRQWAIVANIPRTASGKILRRGLKQLWKKYAGRPLSTQSRYSGCCRAGLMASSRGLRGQSSGIPVAVD